MRFALLAALLALGCGNDKTPTKASTTPAPETAKAVEPTKPAEPTAAKPAEPAPIKPADPAPSIGRDFTPEGKALFIVGACGDGTSPEAEAVSAKQRKAHCDVVSKAQTEYGDRWVSKARAFFAEKVPATAPKKVVYPFAGGDLSTALTVYPDADEITTLSLEPAGDPRTISTLKGAEMQGALAKVEFELKWLYRVNFSNTINMIDAMRGGRLPTQLIFGLSALKLHGYELVGVRYFSINDDGALHYLSDDDIANAFPPAKGKKAAAPSAEQRNMLFANVEVQFKKGSGRTQVWRHIRANLGNETSKGIGAGLKADPRVLRHLETKGPIAAMTKAASYLLSWDSFSLMRDYLIKNTVWMVSDATGVAPKWGKPAGFEYETYGMFEGPHIEAGSGIAKDWRTEFEKQSKRALKFRFGYYDEKFRNHLVIMKKKS